MARAVKKSANILKVIKTVKLPSLKASALTPEQMRERIFVLRSDMSQSVNLSTSTSILALLLFIGAPSVFPNVINPYLPSSLKIMQAFVAIPTVFWIYTVLGNIVRFVMIFRLQKKLSSK